MNLVEEVNTAARIVAREWSDFLDIEELVQELWVVLCDRQYTETLATLEPPARYSTLRKIGRQVASKLRYDYDHFTGQFHYSTSEVRKLLTDGRLTKEKAKTYTEWADLDMGWRILANRNANYSETLVQAFCLDTYDNNTGTARKNLSRAIDALTQCMNSAHKRAHATYVDGPGTRRIRSNGNAIAYTARQLGHENTERGFDGYHL